MTATAKPVVVKLGTPPDIVAAMPSFIGFHPRESLIVMCLHGPRKRNGLTMRFDLPQPRHHRAMVSEITARVTRQRAGSVILVCYTAATGADGKLPRADLVERLAQHLVARDVGVVEALLVRGGRWYSYTCTDSCCPSSGTPIPAHPAGAAAMFAAEAALQGRSVLPDREALEASVRGPVALRRISLTQTYDRVAAEMAAELSGGDVESFADGTVALARKALDGYVEGRRDLTDDAAARIVLGLHDKPSRDELTTWGIGDHVDEFVVLLTDLAQRALDEEAAPVCTVLASVVYQRGGGALVGVALERALRCDPGYTMARMLAAMLDGQVEPAELRSLSRAVRRDLRRR
ncbi:MAG: DUF4192 domain-containing protein [Jiangellaceae bacterium]